MDNLQVLVLYDGKPGHESQVMGLAHLIKNFSAKAVSFQVMAAKPKLKLFNKLIRHYAGSERCHSWVLSCFDFQALPQRVPDLIMSFGGSVVALNVAFSRLWQVPNLVIGNCYAIPEQHVAVNVTAFGRPKQKNAISTKIALCKTDKQKCLQLGLALKQQSQGKPLWTMLVGGEGSGYHYNANDWHQLGQSLRQLANQYGIRWLLSTSRRTGSEGVDILRSYMGPDWCMGATWYGYGSYEPIDALLGAGERIFCTEDSLSMLSESIAMECGVISLVPAQANTYGVHKNSLEYLASVGLIERLAISELAQYQPSEFAPQKSYQHHLKSIFDDTQTLLQQTI